MYNIIRSDELTGPEVIDSTDHYDEAKWLKKRCMDSEPSVCFYIECCEDDDDQKKISELESLLSEVNREFDIVDGACDYWKQEAEDLQSQVEYLKKQIVLMA